VPEFSTKERAVLALAEEMVRIGDGSRVSDEPGLRSGQSSATMRLRDCCTPLGSSGCGTSSTWPSSFLLGRSCRK
jgi:hypothetical protein